MDSAMIAKISKAREYAQQPERISFKSFEVEFQGKHQSYKVAYTNGIWQCECDFFEQRGVCSHTMAMERLLGVMLSAPEPATA
jgi:hypothetical protein